MALPTWAQLSTPIRHLRSALFLVLTYLITAALSQEDEKYNSTCLDDVYKDPTIQHPGSIFASDVWIRRGRCIRDTDSYEVCRENLMAVLDDLIPLQQTEYGASAGVLTLLPTAGALFGSPTAELWALLRMSPVAGFLAQCLTFGGTMVPSQTEDYLKVSKNQGCTTMRVPAPSTKAAAERGDAEGYESVAEEVQRTIRHTLDRDRQGPQRYAGLSARDMFWVGCAVLVVFNAASQACLAVIEQGSIYANWCTSIWWAHIWYLIVTFVAIVDGYINLPFREQWKVYITRQNATLVGRDIGAFGETRFELDGIGSNAIEDAMKNALPRPDAVEAGTASDAGSPPGRQVLVVISVSQDDKRQPYWLSGLRLFFRAGSIVCYVFATSVFAAVTLLAMPMAQMVLTVIVGSGFFSRAVVQKMVKTVYDERPVVHLIAEDKRTADRMLADVMRTGLEPEDASSSYVFEVDGKLWIRQVCVGVTKRWKRWLFGVMAGLPVVGASGAAARESKGTWSTVRQTDY
ncbi:hypothetical protein CSOJ01_08372 [Colletotrichum sojae]|uniref:Uncharacterized protein n=1 Tax=Colletotrichum sojae TaxID=2175907 RepID=A0A8H6J6V0_9PEZI|nr:hypothetical protein CSOJ01_08372 [Colletotrichum sojae]